MKVAQFSTSEGGGAGIAVKRLSEALRLQEVESDIITLNDFTNDSMLYKKGIIKLDYIISNIVSKSNKTYPFSTGYIGIENRKLKDIVQKYDVIHIHWINNGFLSTSNLKYLVDNSKKIVITMHDSWFFTGGCHVKLGCDGYINKCNNCKYTNKAFKNIAEKNQKIKGELLNNNKVNVITPSEWLMRQVEVSSIKIPNIINIKNCIDDKYSFLQSRNDVRKELGLDKDKKYVMIIMANLTDKHKGGKYIKEILERLNSDIEVLLVGDDTNIELLDLRGNYKALGYISDETKLKKIYYASDALINPTIDDNLPYVLIESMLMGTPVISFNVGGIPEIVDKDVNGYLAQIGDVSEIINGINKIIYSNKYLDIRKSCSEKIKREFNMDGIAKKHIQVYKGEDI